MARKKQVIKTSELTQSTGTLSLVACRLFNVLLYHSFNSLLEKNQFELPLKTVFRDMGWSGSHNYDHLKAGLTELMSHVLKWNLLLKTAHKWKACQLLGPSEIEVPQDESRAVVRWKIQEELVELLAKPDMFVKISLLLQNKFRSAHSLKLYEIALDYLGTDKLFKGQTKMIEIENWKEIFGVTDKYLKPDKSTNFPIFNRDVLKKAAKEVEKEVKIKTDIKLRRIKGRVVAVKLIFTRKDTNAGVIDIVNKNPDYLWNTLKSKELEDKQFDRSFAYKQYVKSSASEKKETERCFFNYIESTLSYIHLVEIVKKEGPESPESRNEFYDFLIKYYARK